MGRPGVLFMFTLMVVGSLARPQTEVSNDQQGRMELLDIEDVVQTVSRFARNIEADGNIRVARQIGGAPLGPPGPYRYGYAVQDDIGNDFNKQETSDGGTVQGQYSVLLPDGRIQTVTYSVAPNTGFVVIKADMQSTKETSLDLTVSILEELQNTVNMLGGTSSDSVSDEELLSDAAQNTWMWMLIYYVVLLLIIIIVIIVFVIRRKKRNLKRAEECQTTNC